MVVPVWNSFISNVAVIPGVFDHIVVNSNVDEAYSKFKEIVIKASIILVLN